MDSTVSLILMTTPRRSPRDGHRPVPKIFSFPWRSCSPTRTQTLVVPTSIPIMIRSGTAHTLHYLARLRLRVWDAEDLRRASDRLHLLADDSMAQRLRLHFSG